MNNIILENSFLSSANNDGHKLLMSHNYFESPNMMLNAEGTEFNSALPEEKNCKRLTKTTAKKCTSSKSKRENEELKQKESYIVSNSGRTLSSDRERNSSTSSQEYGTENEQNKTSKKNSRKKKELLQVRITSPRHQSARADIDVKKNPAEFKNVNEILKKGYSRNQQEESNSKTLNKTEGQIVIKGQELEALPCGESGKWKYIRMYQERNRRREERLRRKRQKERKGTQGSGRRRSTKKRRKSKKRSKSRSPRKTKGRKSKSRSKSRRRSKRRGSSRSRSKRGSSKRNNR